MKFQAPGLFSGSITTCSIVILSVLAFSSFAQVSQPHRFEKQQKNSDDYFNVISLKEDGLALFRERDKYKNNNKIWELIFLDTALREKKTLELAIKERYRMIGYEVTPDHLFFLFRTGETTKNDFELIDISFSGEETGRYSVKPDLDFKLTHFSRVGKNFVFGGYVSNEAAIILYETETNGLKVVPGFFQKDTELVDLRVNQNQTFNTVLIDRSLRDDRKLIFRTFDETGKQLLEDVIPIDENRSLQTGITSTLEREDLVIMGTWGERNAKQSLGFYALTIDPFSNQKIAYIDFGQLNHYLEYLSPKRAARVKENSKEDAEAGRLPSFTNYVMPFKITEYKEGFLLLAEVYNPVSNLGAYNSNPYYYNPFYSPYGYYPYWPGGGYYYPGMSRMYRPYMYGPNVKNADEIKTQETVLLAFDGKGKVMWDQSIKLDEIKMPGIEQVADFSLQKSKVYFIYKKESELNIKTILLDTEEVKESVEKIKPLEDLDEIRSEKDHEGGVRHWYGDTFYVWGYQTIRNINKEDRVRDVFYINKVVAQ
jgi:hypothetical protein